MPRHSHTEPLLDDTGGMKRSFPYLRSLGIGFVAFSPLANGLLTNSYSADSKFDASTDYRAAMPQYSKESFEKNRMLFLYINDLAEKHGATPSQISLAWMMGKKPTIVPIPGTRKLNRLKENAGAADIHLSIHEIEEIDRLPPRFRCQMCLILHYN